MVNLFEKLGNQMKKTEAANKGLFGGNPPKNSTYLEKVYAAEAAAISYIGTENEARARQEFNDFLSNSTADEKRELAEYQKRRKKQEITIIATLIVLFVLLIVIGVSCSNQPQTKLVPNVVGQGCKTAIASLKEAYFEATCSDPNSDKYTITSQSLTGEQETSISKNTLVVLTDDKAEKDNADAADKADVEKKATAEQAKKDEEKKKQQAEEEKKAQEEKEAREKEQEKADCEAASGAKWEGESCNWNYQSSQSPAPVDTAPTQAPAPSQSSNHSPNSGVTDNVSGYCNDGTYVTGNPSARGKANACYGHKGWRDY